MFALYFISGKDVKHKENKYEFTSDNTPFGSISAVINGTRGDIDTDAAYHSVVERNIDISRQKVESSLPNHRCFDDIDSSTFFPLFF